MSDIPSDLFTNILTLLPIPSLLRFRSTSKSLRILIDSHNFINLHLKNSLNFNLILRYESKIYQFDFPNLTTCVELNSPLTFNINMTRFIGSCNGLLCIYDTKLFAFWNPNLRKHWIIPNFPYLHRSDSAAPYILSCVNGFGFDPFTGDYKLVRIRCFSDGSEFNFFDAELSLFSSRTNSWKLLPSMPYIICTMGALVGVFVHHSLHWVASRNSLEFKYKYIIVAINLTLENFNEVPLPPDLRGVGNRDKFYFDIEVLGGCLCMLVNYGSTEIDVWVMKEYGSRDSWCKLFTLMNSLCLSRPLKYLRPLGYSSDGKKVLLRVNFRLFWYDLMSEKLSCVCVKGIPYWEEAMICVESLVPPSCLPIESQNMSRCEIKSKTRGESNGRTSNSVSETGCSRCLWFWK